MAPGIIVLNLGVYLLLFFLLDEPKIPCKINQ